MAAARSLGSYATELPAPHGVRFMTLAEEVRTTWLWLTAGRADLTRDHVAAWDAARDAALAFSALWYAAELARPPEPCPACGGTCR